MEYFKQSKSNKRKHAAKAVSDSQKSKKKKEEEKKEEDTDSVQELKKSILKTRKKTRNKVIDEYIYFAEKKY